MPYVHYWIEISDNSDIETRLLSKRDWDKKYDSSLDLIHECHRILNQEEATAYRLLSMFCKAFHRHFSNKQRKETYHEQNQIYKDYFCEWYQFSSNTCSKVHSILLNGRLI